MQCFLFSRSTLLSEKNCVNIRSGMPQRKHRAILSFVVALLLLSLPSMGQSAERIDEYLERQRLDVAQAAYLAAASASLIPADSGAEQALDALSERGFEMRQESLQADVRLDEFSFMLMLAHDLPGGFMYALFPGPRYAYRDLRYERIIEGGGDPGEPVSGRRAMRLVGRAMDFSEEVDG